jgi:hypothetical protein
MTRLAKQYRCSLNVTAACGRGNGRPTRKACAACGGRWFVQEGVYGVFVHSSISGSDRYAERDADRTFSTEAAADRYRTTQDPSMDRLVVRFVSVQSTP